VTEITAFGFDYDERRCFEAAYQVFQSAGWRADPVFSRWSFYINACCKLHASYLKM